MITLNTCISHSITYLILLVKGLKGQLHGLGITCFKICFKFLFCVYCQSDFEDWFEALGVFQNRKRNMGAKFASCLKGCIIQSETENNCLCHLLVYILVRKIATVKITTCSKAQFSLATFRFIKSPALATTCSKKFLYVHMPICISEMK